MGNLQGTVGDEKGKTNHSFTSTEAHTCSSDAGLHRSKRRNTPLAKRAALTDTNGRRRDQKLALGTEN